MSTFIAPDPAGPPADLDVVIINYRTPTILRRCLESWQKHAPSAVGVRTNIIVVDVDPDPGSDAVMMDEASGAVATGPWAGMGSVTWLRVPSNVGYSGACNRAAALGSAPLIAFFNADTALINDEAIPTMIQFFDDHPMDHPELGQRAAIAGPLQTDEEGMVTHAGIFGTLAAPKHRAFKEPVADDLYDVRPAITVSGSAYFVRRSTWNLLTSCPLYQERIAPGATGAMLPTPHFFEETWVSYHGWAHRQTAWYVGTAHLQHLFDRAPKPDASWSRRVFDLSQPIFRAACDAHGIDHD